MLNCEHGGNLDKAISQFGGDRKDWLDLSTGINPHSFSVFEYRSELWRELPDQDLVESAIHSARDAYQSKFECLPLAGVQQAIQLFPSIIKAKAKQAWTESGCPLPRVLSISCWHSVLYSAGSASKLRKVINRSQWASDCFRRKRSGMFAGF